MKQVGSDELVKVKAKANAAPPSKMALARSLDDATATSFLYVDRRGEVRSPLRFRLLQGLGYTSLAGLVALPVLYGISFGPLGALFAGGASVVVGMRARHGIRLQRAVRLLQDERADEAEDIFRSILTARLVPRRLRGMAHYNLAVCLSRKNCLEEALSQTRAAQSHLGRGRPMSLFTHLATYLEINTLVGLGRIEQARRVLYGAGCAPEGEYLQVCHWISELYVCFAEGGHTFSDDEIYQRARKGLAMTSGSVLLALTGWAYAVSGDLEQSNHLLRESFDRLANDRIASAMPRLYEWMEAHRPPPEDDWDGWIEGPSEDVWMEARPPATAPTDDND